VAGELERRVGGRRSYAIVVVAEGAHPAGGSAVVLGHLLRGGSPTAIDRTLGLVFGTAAVRALGEGQSGIMVAVNPPRIEYVPLKQAIARMKSVPLDGEGVLTARSLGISLGD